jgi:hypothetical protein
MRVPTGVIAIVAALFGCAEGVMAVDLGEDEPTPSTPSPRDAGRADASKPVPVADAGAGTTDAGGMSDGGGTTVTECKGTSSCPVPLVSGNVSGDKGADSLTLSGTTSAWHVVRVTENDSGFSGRKLKVKVTLTSPASSNFDLYLYDKAPADCTTAWRSSTQSSGVDTSAASWGEGSVANGDDDDKDVYIEVRHNSGVCSASATWSVQVEGNVN